MKSEASVGTVPSTRLPHTRSVLGAFVLILTLALTAIPHSDSLYANEPTKPVFTISDGVGPPGGTGTVTVAVSSTSDLHAINLLVNYQVGRVLRSPLTIQINEAILPTIRVGSHHLNSIRVVEPGRIRLIGLAPEFNGDGGMMGSITFEIGSEISPGEEEIITLSGQARLFDGTLVDIEPVTGVVRVVRFDQNQYLPLITQFTQFDDTSANPSGGTL